MASSDEDFLCSSVTDRFDTATITPGTDNVPTEQQTLSQASAEQLLTEENQSQVGPTSSNNIAASGPFQLESPIRNPTEEAETITPDSVRPYPKAGSRKRKKGKTRILTDTPEKRLIEMAEQERQRKNKIKEDRKNNSKKIGKKRIPKLVEELTSKGGKNRKMSSDNDIENDSLSDKTFVEEDFDEDDVIVLDRNFQVNDFVLVKFDTTKNVYHYVGRIEEVSNSMAIIKFMRMSKIRNTFIYPDIEDISSVPLNDIKTKLLVPLHGLNVGAQNIRLISPSGSYQILNKL
ncbi:hypothetical protein ILUMI_24037 [Ignelater luminosus]|uniref:Uncharacterized protein n=1 Tax=Ignelater luminosus TaxID=2038154 RepID=A0A8K0CE71_IGNLU|nr:hypothetical protein ILUMI_24037 [Ignelater luminosus]